MGKHNDIKLAAMLFNEDGSFKKQLDPYRYNDTNKDLYDLLFDEDGDANWEAVNAAREFANKYNCHWNSDIVKYIYSADIPSYTRYNYKSIFAWR